MVGFLVSGFKEVSQGGFGVCLERISVFFGGLGLKGFSLY